MGLPALFESFQNGPVAIFVSLFVVLLASYTIYQRQFHPLAKYAGPLICSLTDLYKMWATWNDRIPEEMIRLHEKYGDVVRIAPNDLHFNRLEAVNDIYKRGWQKGEFYKGFDQRNPGLFAEPDEGIHARRKRRFGANFSEKSIREYESIIDSRYAVLRKQLDRFAESQEVSDLRRYITYAIVDILGCLAFSQPLGNQHAEDPKKIPRVSEFLWANCVAGSAPWLAPFLEWIRDHVPPSAEMAELLEGRNTVIRMASENIQRRSAMPTEEPDILGRIIAATEEGSGKKLSHDQIMAECIDLIVGGTHTTGNTLHLLFANLARHPEYLQQCVEEIDRNLPALSAEEPCYKIMGLEEKLEFVNICILENFRKDPVGTFNMPRVVPIGGATIAGHFVPAGTQVSMNIHAFHHNKAVWGEDHGDFDPARWYDEKRAKGLESLVIPFSVGKRACVGQNLANANILKMFTTLLRCYEFEFVNSDEPMVVVSHGDSDLRTPVLVKVKMRGSEYTGAVPEE
ncbi:uncharacterized protein RHO25_004867 [Cercospora beticola]|uniref:Cytochrome P450 n=2 Tax=Cercospora beticola TaxID=122368 RepID=A0ABZ0NL30_CERBT|nr:hypothetical protein RHO25_004867 [Cercospora beticola]CAK1361556.1 unnamed protein product [Cercospora beticola]